MFCRNHRPTSQNFLFQNNRNAETQRESCSKIEKIYTKMQVNASFGSSFSNHFRSQLFRFISFNAFDENQVIMIGKS